MSIFSERKRARPGEKPRRHSGSAKFHMSKAAVTLTLENIYAMTAYRVHEFWVAQRWGSRDLVVCPHCGTIHEHPWRKEESRWKCAACDGTFSVTSGTPFDQHKRSLRQLLALALTWVNGTSGVPALMVRRNTGGRYNCVFVNDHKLREALMKIFNTGFVAGEVEMDGVHISGRNAKGKRGKPQITQPNETVPVGSYTPEQTAQVLQSQMQAASTRASDKARERRNKGKESDGTYGQTLDKDRRIVICVRTRSGTKGVGARATRVVVGRTEGPIQVNEAISKLVAVRESILNTDKARAYIEPGRQFRQHLSVEHAKELVGPNGENTNLGEEFARRHKRSERGMYLNIEPKFQLDYAVESAWRSDTSRLGNGGQLAHLLAIALRSGRSKYWRGYTRGKHRDFEFLAGEAPGLAKPSGPPKGRKPNSQMNGRPPR